MTYKKCPNCKGTMIKKDDIYRCSQCNYEAKTKDEIEKLETYKNTP